MAQTTYKDLTIAPYNVLYIKDLKIAAKINEHAQAEITAVLPDTEKDNPIYQTTAATQIRILADTSETGLLFTGTVQRINLQQISDVYYLSILALSDTVQMDINLRSRSFQNENQTYKAMVKEIAYAYPGGDIIDTVTNEDQLDKFIMQYEETDWQFVKRLASLFNAGLVPSYKINHVGPRYFFGLPKGKDRGNLTEYNYTLVKEITGYLREKANGNPDLGSLDKLYYQVTSEEFFNIGDTVNYQGRKLYIQESVTQIEQAVVVNHYKLSTAQGCSRAAFYNDQIIGLSLPGTVIQTATDQVKLHLNIDDSQDPATAHFFKHTTMYTASGNSGLYCMPELGDTVYLYCPNAKEWEAVTQDSIRSQSNPGDKISDPNIKYWRTRYGKEIKLAPDEVLITCVDDQNYIKLNQTGGIEIYSTQPIKITTAADLTIEASKSIVLNAADKIELTCQDSSIQMDGNITIQGKEVRHN